MADNGVPPFLSNSLEHGQVWKQKFNENLT